MNLQTIRSINGQTEYVLLPFAIYSALLKPIEKELEKFNLDNDDEYELLDPADYVDNPVALARYKAGITQEELAKRLRVSQAYISKIEDQKTVSPKTMIKVMTALSTKKLKK
jgi:ribosome-binding protein aMBF1 (putative translation factor)